MATEGMLSVSVESVVEDVLKQHGTRPSDIDMASRREEEAASRRNEAADWLRRTVGAVGCRDLAEEPSEEEFRLGLRNGIILCNAFNKLRPNSIKVVEAPPDCVPPPDGAALCAYQYFENVRNFLVALEDLGLPTFEASDLEKGGKGARVVNCVLALKSYSERKQTGSYKFRSNSSSSSSLASNNGNGNTKYFVRKNSEPFVNSFFRTQSSDRIQEGLSVEQNLSLDVSIESSEMTTSHSLHMLVHTMLSDKKPEEVPVLVESVLSKVMQEFESRISTQNELVKSTLRDLNEVKSYIRPGNYSEPLSTPNEAKKEKGEKQVIPKLNKVEKPLMEKQRAPKLNFEQQEREIKELRHMLSSIKSGMMNMKMQYHDEFSNIGKHLFVVSHAASGYHKVLEENRKLYNQVQDLKGNIRVYCRVRPFLAGQGLSAVANYDDGQITITTPSKYGKEGRKSFSFNKVFGPSSSQEDVFADMRPLIRSVLDGYNVCIFAYGQTGSGKTYTMSGPKELREQTMGVNYRALNDLFHMSAQRKDTFSYDISVQMIEIYNEQVRDLLSSGGITKKLEIRNSSQKGGPAVPDANMVPVASTSQVIELMNLGHKNRAVGSTAMNDRSSRSHSCLTVHVQGRDLTSGAALRGCMHLVDLAGSERVDKSEAKGDRLKEAQHINRSLSALGDVISSLAQKNAHVPYRNSKLTQLLQDSLGGQAKTLMFVHISPEVDAVGETLSTLKFAERVATVELGAARSNKDTAEVKELKDQIASLKAQLARNDGAEFEQVQNVVSTPISRTKSFTATTPVQTLLRQPMEEVGNIEVRSNLPSIQKKPSLESQEISVETDSASPWVDKTIIDTNNENLSSVSLPGGEHTPLPTSFYQRYSSNVSITYQDSELGGSGDSDELELGTSYSSSEQDLLMWRSDVPKLGNSASMSRLKKPQAKVAASQDMRSGNVAYKPSPSRKMSTPKSSIRQPNDGKRTIAAKK
ncbi:hypothetical protein LUZ60_015831 [Juncus effusus]|nr:hypothetical protein LUZ60_015831 [Juncus effusus]